MFVQSGSLTQGCWRDEDARGFVDAGALPWWRPLEGSGRAYKPSKTAKAASIRDCSPVALSSSISPRMTARARVAWAWAVTSSVPEDLSSSVNCGSQSWTLARPNPGNRSG